MSEKKTLKGIWYILKQSGSGFLEHKVAKLSASLAYYTVFSFPPLLIVVTYVCSIFFGRKAVEGAIYDQIQSFVGSDTAIQLQQIIKNATISNDCSIKSISTLSHLPCERKRFYSNIPCFVFCTHF